MASKHNEVTLTWIELLVLARYVHTKPPGPQELAKILIQLALPSDSPAQSRAKALGAQGSLVQKGLLAKPAAKRRRGLVISEEGQRALCAKLALPTTPKWTDVRDRHLPTLAVGSLPGSADARDTTKTWETLALRVLRGEKAVPEAPTLLLLGNALLLAALGLPSGAVTMDRLRMAALAKAFDMEPRGTFEELVKRVVVKTLRVRDASKASIVPALTRRWLGGQINHGSELWISAMENGGSKTSNSQEVTAADPSRNVFLEKGETPEPKPFSEEELLGIVHAVIPRVGVDGRFGDEKIFVSAIWRGVERDRRLGSYSLDRFKKWLLNANRRGQLALARADLVSAMDPKLVAESEIEDRGATFHFVLDPRSLQPATSRRSHVR
jgi:hypothetical protein